MGMTATGTLSQVRVQRDPTDPGRWTLSNGEVEIGMDAKAGRIMRYGFVGGRNAMWANSDPLNREYLFGAFVNYGGDKIWIWPQDYWDWPPPELKAGYTVRRGHDGKSLTMAGTIVAYGVHVTRTIELAPEGSSMIVTSAFEPSGAGIFDAPLAVWSVTQVPTPHRLFVRIRGAADRQRYLTRKVDDFYEATVVSDSLLRLRPDSTRSVKTFMDGDVLAAVYSDMVLLQWHIPAHAQGTFEPDQRAQIYSHPIAADDVPPGGSYTELEWTAPILPHARIAASPLRVGYKLVKIREKTTDEQIARLVEELP